MGVTLDELSLKNFRNHEDFALRIQARQLVLIGRNAAGKTNIIEALQLLSMLRSFRTGHWQEVVRREKGSQEDLEETAEGNPEENKGRKTVLRAAFTQNSRELVLELRVEEGRRTYFLNDKKRPREDLIGLVPAVLFVPDDLEIVKGPAERRRALIDGIGQQLSKTYDKLLRDYQKIVRQRNHVLRELDDPTKSFELSAEGCPLILESWNESLIVIGAQLLLHRIGLFTRFKERAAERYETLSGGEELSCLYESKVEDTSSREAIEASLRQQLNERRAEERRSCRTLIGPHCDEISFAIEERNARTYGSQGQQRSIALACKLAELDLIREISGNGPLLLLDDVMSELDTARRAALLGLIEAETCAIITATDTACLDDALLSAAQVVKLP